MRSEEEIREELRKTILQKDAYNKEWNEGKICVSPDVYSSLIAAFHTKINTLRWVLGY